MSYPNPLLNLILPISTLRYYDKQGLFPNIKRNSGIRSFGEDELETLRIIECLKKSGLEIKDIKQFIEWWGEGSKSYPNRKALMEHQKSVVEAEILHMNKVLDMLKFKCWYYEQVILDGNEERLKQIIPNHLPEEIDVIYRNAHKEPI